MEKILKGLSNYGSTFQEKIGHLKKATETDAQIIWQYVRFNSNYQVAFDEATAWAETMSDESASDIFNHLGDSWSLYPYAVDPAEETLPEEFYFEIKVDAKAFKIHEIIENKKRRDKFWSYLKLYHSQNETVRTDQQIPTKLLIALNPMADKKVIQEEVERLTEKIKREFMAKAENVPATDSPALRGRGTPNLIENLCAYYLIHKLKITSPKLATEKMAELLGVQRTVPYQGQHLKKMAIRFEKVSAISPWCFFLKPN